MISFVVFVDDAPAEAVSVWILELISVTLEFMTYWEYRILFREGEEKLAVMDEKIADRVEKGYRRSALYRERKDFRQIHGADKRRLHRHLIGVTINMVLVVITLLLIIFVARSGGMCVYDMKPPNLFNSKQADLCGALRDCNGENCQICPTPTDFFETREIPQCYFKYF